MFAEQLPRRALDIWKASVHLEVQGMLLKPQIYIYIDILQKTFATFGILAPCMQLL